ncbi:MAG: hypothetical protein JWR65_3325 [Massilia sp.]|nr:hypothetical protein [Massilia sp.]
MCYAYLGGAPGVLASALAWFTAACVAMYGTAQKAVLALFAGGMMIHPLGVLISKGLGRPGAHVKGNPLGNLALEGTVWMLLGLVLAYGLSLWRIDMFFPAMLLIIGGRYLTFATVYGMRIYWACGVALAAAGFLLSANFASPANGAFVGSAIELVFAVTIYVIDRSRLRSGSTPDTA